MPAGYTVNDIFTALWTGTIRRYLEKTGDKIINNKDMLMRGQAPFAIPRPTVPKKTQVEHKKKKKEREKAKKKMETKPKKKKRNTGRELTFFLILLE